MSEILVPEPETKKPKKKQKIFKLVKMAFLGAILLFARSDSNTTHKNHNDNLNQKSVSTEAPTVTNQSSALPEFTEEDKGESPIVFETVKPDLPTEPEPVKPTSDDEVEEEQEVPPPIIFGDGEYTQYVIDNFNQESVGIPLNDSNSFFAPTETNAVVIKTFTNDQFMRNVVSLFYPEKTDEEITDYLQKFKLLIGEKIDYYLTEVRSGSWGTTVATITEDGQLVFETISLRSDLVSQSYTDDEWGSLTRLVREEFFQAHQYTVFATLFNNKYLSEVAGTNTVDDMIEAVSYEHLRAFLELFPQQKILTDSGAGGNAYNFYIGNELFEGNPTAKITVDAAYNTLTSFIENKLGITTTPESFLNPDKIVEINESFRDEYFDYYLNLGFHPHEINIWNLVGMKRNSNDPAHSLDMPALLPIPIE